MNFGMKQQWERNLFSWEVTTIPDTPYIFMLRKPAALVVDWGDGSRESFDNPTTTRIFPEHTYASAGVYEIRFESGTCDWFALGYPGTTPALVTRITGAVHPSLGVIYCISSFSLLVNCTYWHPGFFDAASILGSTNQGAFQGTTGFNENLSRWDTRNATGLREMFYQCPAFNQDISGWDTGKATTMYGMFYQCSHFNQDLGGWDVGELLSAGAILHSTALSTTNYDKLLIGWAAQVVKPNVPLGVGTTKYSVAAQAAHDTLTGAPNLWIITDGGLLT